MGSLNWNSFFRNFKKKIFVVKSKFSSCLLISRVFSECCSLAMMFLKNDFLEQNNKDCAWGAIYLNVRTALKLYVFCAPSCLSAACQKNIFVFFVLGEIEVFSKKNVISVSWFKKKICFLILEASDWLLTWINQPNQ